MVASFRLPIALAVLALAAAGCKAAHGNAGVKDDEREAEPAEVFETSEGAPAPKIFAAKNPTMPPELKTALEQWAAPHICEIVQWTLNGKSFKLSDSAALFHDNNLFTDAEAAQLVRTLEANAFNVTPALAGQYLFRQAKWGDKAFRAAGFSATTADQTQTALSIDAGATTRAAVRLGEGVRLVSTLGQPGVFSQQQEVVLLQKTLFTPTRETVPVTDAKGKTTSLPVWIASP